MNWNKNSLIPASFIGDILDFVSNVCDVDEIRVGRGEYGEKAKKGNPH